MTYKLYSPRRHTDKNTEQWSGRTVSGDIEALEGRLITKVLDKHLPLPPARCLEAGCGLGAFVHLLHERGYDVTGVELEPSTLRAARQQSPELRIEHGDVTSLPFPDSSFDAYLSFGVLEHIEEGPSQALSEAARVLRDDGIAIITIPCVSTMRRILIHPMRSTYAHLRSLTGRESYFWEYRYTCSEICAYMSQTGFRVIDVAVDDYGDSTVDRHIGLSTDLFFLQDHAAGAFKLNQSGRAVFAFARHFSPWRIAGGVAVVGVKDMTGRVGQGSATEQVPTGRSCESAGT